MPFDLSSLYGGMQQDPRIAQMMQYRQQGQTAGQDMSWMDQPGAIQGPPGPMQARMQQAMQQRPVDPGMVDPRMQQMPEQMPMDPAIRQAKMASMQRPPMPQRPMPPLQSLRPQGPPPGAQIQQAPRPMPQQAQGPQMRQRPGMGFGGRTGGMGPQGPMNRRPQPQPQQAPGPLGM